MPKAEKELRKDVTPLQQNVKRKTQDPGTPTDVEVWTGSTSTKYRWASYIPTTLAFIFIGCISHLVDANSGWTFQKQVLAFFDTTILKNVEHSITNSLSLNDELTTELNP